MTDPKGFMKYKRKDVGHRPIEERVKDFGEINLVDQHGEMFTKERFLGKWTLVFFGFTYCPDICPTTMSFLNDLMGQLDGTEVEDTDVLMVNNSGPARMLINRVGNRNHWIGLRLVGDQTKRDMLGARVEVLLKNGARLRRRVHTDGSYCSANDPRVLVGLGKAGEVAAVKVFWPSGKVETWPNVTIDS